MITCISLSKEPLIRDMPSDMVYLNHVSTFSSSSTMNDQMLLAVSEVDTPYFFFCDSDDPIPELMLYPKDKGILYGDFYIQQNNNLEVIKMGPWSRDKHLYNPLLIHKPVCNTQYAKAILEFMPKGEYHFESIFYFFLAKHFGFEYVHDFKVIWNKGETGLHTTVKQRLRNSSMYLLMNEDTVSKKINQVYKG